MSTLPEVRGALPGADEDLDGTAPHRLSPIAETLPSATRPWPGGLGGLGGLGGRLSVVGVDAGRALERARPALAAVRYPLAVYAASRLIYLILGMVDTFAAPHVSILSEITHWDGLWYVKLAYWGYPSHVITNQWSTLGFFPTYSLVLRGAAIVTGLPGAFAGLAVSLVSGASATVLVGRLALRWFGDERSSRRAVLFFCLFPGSIVFSIDYTEGILITLIAGVLLAVEHRRWLLAGVLAGLATAVGPVGVAIIPALGVGALLEVRRRGWRDPEALRALAAPLLAPAGLVAFGIYLWAHTGNPFASYIAQHDAWGEHSGPLAIYYQGYHLVRETLRLPGGWKRFNLNLLSGVLGAAFLAWALSYLWRARRRLSAVAITWTLGVALLTVTSDQVPPNPRMLLCAFPLLVAIAAELGRRGYRRLIGWSSTALVVMSLLTVVASLLRP